MIKDLQEVEKNRTERSHIPFTQFLPMVHSGNYRIANPGNWHWYMYVYDYMAFYHV